MDSSTYRKYNNGAGSPVLKHEQSARDNAEELEMIVRHGMLISAARYFGASTNSIGSSAMTRRESSSSVTFMVPSRRKRRTRPPADCNLCDQGSELTR